MSRNKKNDQAEAAVVEDTAAAASAKAAAPAPRKGKAASPKVYCGPTVRGVAKQYTVYSGEIPVELENFIQQHPEAAALVVPVEEFAQKRKKVETAGTAEAILYHKIKSNL